MRLNSLRCLTATRVGEPDAGNLHVRFDEGEQLKRLLPTRLVIMSNPYVGYLRYVVIQSTPTWATCATW
jgi:hypothetical protein